MNAPPGRSIENAPLHPSDGRDFGRALARLHGTKYSSAAARIYRRFFTVRMGLDDLRASLVLPGFDANLVSIICKESQQLRDRDFFGPIGFSYGDVTPRHFFLTGRDDFRNPRQFTWLDLDDIGILPLRLSLAAAELRLFYRDPGLIAAFNEAYFAHDPRPTKCTLPPNASSLNNWATLFGSDSRRPRLVIRSKTRRRFG